MTSHSVDAYYNKFPARFRAASGIGFHGMTTETQRKHYICPGETYSISRSVHLARLASFYPPCRECQFRCETGQLPARTVQQLKQTERRVERKSLFTTEGIRGVYINEVSRTKTAHFAAAFASLLLENSPLHGLMTNEEPTSNRRPPSVVVGLDQRSSSPDIAAGAISGLRRMGCAVIDVGPTTKPHLWFTVRERRAAAGILVTGSGCEPSWTGLDFCVADGRPISGLPDDDDSKISLNRLEALAKTDVPRASRSAGEFRSLQTAESYEASLRNEFHALRPLRIVVGCPTRLVLGSLKRLFAPLPCRLIPLELADRARDVTSEDDADILRVGHSVRDNDAHLGVVIDDDGLQCGFLDERGQLVPASEITRIMSRDSSTESLINESLPMAMISDQLAQHGKDFVGENCGRFWFREHGPSCDAILAVAAMLAALSETDALFSDVARVTV